MKKQRTERMESKKKRILVLYYSQTGQLTNAVRAVMSPLEGHPSAEITWEELRPKRPYPFPWPTLDFLDVFPESVYLDPPEMEPVRFDPDSRFDLVVLAYQVWFLSPSLPVTGFLKSDAARALKETPVITLIACRNMWLNAHGKVKRMLDSIGARLIDNIVLTDQGPGWTTFITTPRWLLTGKKEGFWSIFPPAGVKAEDIENSARFGTAIADSMDKLDKGIPLLRGLGAVKVNPAYIASENMAHRGFLLWGRVLRLIGRQGDPLRKCMLLGYLAFLVGMILTLVPLGMAARAALRPFLKKRLNEQVKRLEEPSGSSTELVSKYLNKNVTVRTKEAV